MAAMMIQSSVARCMASVRSGKDVQEGGDLARSLGGNPRLASLGNSKTAQKEDSFSLKSRLKVVIEP